MLCGLEGRMLHVEINGVHLAVDVVRHKRSKRMRLRYSPIGKLRLSVPWHAKACDIQRFLDHSVPWLQERVQQKYEPVLCSHGATIPILGREYIVHTNGAVKRGVSFEGNQLVLRGPENCIDIIVRSFLRQELARFCAEQSHQYAAALGVHVQTIRVRNMRSRWGSCSASGNLSFSYHLIFAPQEIVQYVCAHEVAHLREMNHSPAFWQEVAKLYPNYKNARAWLKKEGKSLFRYS